MTSANATVIGSLGSIPLQTNKGTEARLTDYAGKVLLIVNVASKCGLTPQYEGFQKLYDEQRSRGFEVLAFPANDFMGQEPGSDPEIADFCKLTYSIEFPLFAKTVVTGRQKHPLYAALIEAQPHAAVPAGSGLRSMLVERGIPVHPEPELLWNFEKFLINREGAVVARFSPDTAPNDSDLIAAIERLLT